MDWIRAKNILIIAFIIVNIFLGKSLYDRNIKANKVIYLDETSLNIIHNLLTNQNVILETDIPVTIPQMAFLELEYFEMDFMEIGGSFFGDLEGVYIDIRADDVSSGMFSRGEEQLIVNSNGTIVYFNYGQKDILYEKLTEELAVQIAKEFIEGKKGLPDDAIVYRVTHYEGIGSYGIEFIQEYGGYYIGNSSIQIEVTQTGVRSYLQFWVKPKGNVGDRKPVIPAAEVLLRVADRLNAQNLEGPIIIKDIKLGYYSKHYDAATFVAVPAWRIWVKGSSDIYVNAYTGEFEQ